jgi:lipopolysaccharide biosynthesis protein
MASASTHNKKARLIALYLPQYHPIPENDEWWGTGFTEWTNTAKARPFFKGHYQPHVPADLGFYDLRVEETRIAQAEMARDHGIEGFCYYHYWFGGKQLLQRPFEEVVRSGKPDYPFCLCWANETWTGVWHGAPNRILIEQTYPGIADHQAHFDCLREAFFDSRHILVDGKPLFMIYKPNDLPDQQRITDLWREMAVKAGLPGLYLVGAGGYDWNPVVNGFDAATSYRIPPRQKFLSPRNPLNWPKIMFRRNKGPGIYTHIEALDKLLPLDVAGYVNHPNIIHAWDNTPRSGKNGLVIHDADPEIYRLCLRKALEISSRHRPEENIVFLKSWNEWAEGNHLEPDMRYGHEFLKIIKDEVFVDE